MVEQEQGKAAAPRAKTGTAMAKARKDEIRKAKEDEATKLRRGARKKEQGELDRRRGDREEGGSFSSW